MQKQAMPCSDNVFINHTSTAAVASKYEVGKMMWYRMLKACTRDEGIA